MYNTLTSSEVLKKIEEGDVPCILAQALLKEDLGDFRSIINVQAPLRYTYLEKARHLITKLSKYHLIITYTEK